MKELVSHASQYQKNGNNWYAYLVSAETTEIIFNYNVGTFSSGTYFPYGDGTNGNTAPIIALAEGWAYYYGHYLADKQYTNYSSTQYEQGIYYYNSYPITGLSSHLNLLEDFDPLNRPNDPFRWIPQGLFYDLIDTRNENVPVLDNVDGYNNNQLFNAFNSSISNLVSYRQNLLNQNGNYQITQVTNLFLQYGY